MSVIGDTIHWYRPTAPPIEDMADIRPQDVGLWTYVAVLPDLDCIYTPGTHWWGEEEPPLDEGPSTWLHPSEHVRHRVTVGGEPLWVATGPHDDDYGWDGPR